jgi:uncharacterized protein YndB with AHSA1/START domain
MTDTTETPTMDTPAYQVLNRRRLSFPHAQVYGAFADPEQLKIWWGPEGFTNRIAIFDLRPGGEWRLTMINENDRAFDNIKEFLEVSSAQIVMQHIAPMHDFIMTMRFEPAGDDATDLTWIMDFAPGQDDGLAPFLEAANEQNFDRLEAHLNSL